MNRRGFLGSILALGAAPAIVRADSLMRIVPREAIIVPAMFDFSGNGNHLYYSGDTTEILVFPTAHTEAERRMVAEYLAGKRGWNAAEFSYPPTMWARA